MNSNSRKSLVLFFFCSILCISSYAQKNLYLANKYYLNEEYHKAIPHYLIAVKSDTSTETIEKLANCYYSTEQYKLAINTYNKILNRKDIYRLSIYNLASSHEKEGNYQDAIKYYTILSNTERNKYNDKIEALNQIITWLVRTPKVEIRKVKEINSSSDEIGIYISENQFYFSSNKFKKTEFDEVKNQKFKRSIYKIYSAKFNIANNTISKPTDFITYSIAKFGDVAHPSLSKNKNTLYFSSTKSVLNSKDKFENNLNVDQSVLNKIDIKNRKHVHYQILQNENNNFKMLHPCISEDGKRLYFSSDQFAGFGKFDLYYLIINDDGTYSKPINLGPILNTKGNEYYPSFANDSVLYFSSDGHLGLGELDIFKAILKDGKIEKVVNLRAPINSPRNDAYYFPLLKYRKGYFCSDRTGGMGGYDVYQFTEDY